MSTTVLEEKREPKLLDRVREALRVRHMSLRTEKAYLHWIRRYILFHGKRHPKEMGEVEINAFLTPWAGSTACQGLRPYEITALIVRCQYLFAQPWSWGDCVFVQRAWYACRCEIALPGLGACDRSLRQTVL